MASEFCVPSCFNRGTTDVPSLAPDSGLRGDRDVFRYKPGWPEFLGSRYDLDPEGVPFATYRKGHHPSPTVARISGGAFYTSCLWYRFSATATDTSLKGYAWACSQLYRLLWYSTRINTETIEITIEAQDRAELCRVRAQLTSHQGGSTGQTFTRIDATTLPDEQWNSAVSVRLTMQAYVSGGNSTVAANFGGVGPNLPLADEGMSVSSALRPTWQWQAGAAKIPTIPESTGTVSPAVPAALTRAPIATLAVIAAITAGLVAIAAALPSV